MQVHGTIKVVFDTQNVSDRFTKREFVLTTDGNTPYPQHCLFQMTQDKCQLLDLYKEGDEVSVDFNLRGHEWNGPQGVKYFNTLDAWKIQKVNTNGGQPVQNNAPVDNRTQAEKDVEAALAKMTPEARAALQKSIDADKAKENTNPIHTNNNDDSLPY